LFQEDEDYLGYKLGLKMLLIKQYKEIEKSKLGERS